LHFYRTRTVRFSPITYLQYTYAIPEGNVRLQLVLPLIAAVLLTVLLMHNATTND